MRPTLDVIRELLVPLFGTRCAQLPETTSLRDDLGAKNLDLVDLLVSIERAFSIEIPDREWRWLSTIATIVAYVDGRLAEKVAA